MTHISSKRTDRVIQIGNLIPDRNGKFNNPQVGRVYSINGISPTIDTMGGVIENQRF